jgi:hypothetical protein
VYIGVRSGGVSDWLGSMEFRFFRGGTSAPAPAPASASSVSVISSLESDVFSIKASAESNMARPAAPQFYSVTSNASSRLVQAGGTLTRNSVRRTLAGFDALDLGLTWARA